MQLVVEAGAGRAARNDVSHAPHRHAPPYPKPTCSVGALATGARKPAHLQPAEYRVMPVAAMYVMLASVTSFSCHLPINLSSLSSTPEKSAAHAQDSHVRVLHAAWLRYQHPNVPHVWTTTLNHAPSLLFCFQDTT